MWNIGPHRLASRLLLGTRHYPNLDVMAAVHLHSGTGMVTLPIRAFSEQPTTTEMITDHIDRSSVLMVPSTAGCFTPEDAISTANMASELLETRWIKLTIHGCARTMFLDMEGTLEAARELVKEGFYVLPSCTDDPVLCERLADIGCVAVLPLSAAQDSGRGLANPRRLELIRNAVSIPMIVEADINTASNAAQAMEIGADAVLTNTTIARAVNPEQMAQAMKLAVQSGRAAFLAGRVQSSLSVDSSIVDADAATPTKKGAAP